MALDMYTESSSLNTSPRLSFSHNLLQNETTTTPATSHTQNSPNRLDSSLLESNSDFDFRLTNDTIQPIEFSPADELFSQGQIRPLKLQERFTNSNQISISNSQLPPLPVPNTLSKNGIFNQENTHKAIIISDQKQPNSNPNSNSKSFWKIKRSSSLHVDNTYKKSSFWSSLPLLSRSNSTGSSVPSPKLSSQRQPKNSMAPMNSSSSSSSSSFYMYTLSQKPPLKRNYGGGVGYGNGVRISPVLNVAPHFISKGTASLFGLGSLFGSGKDKKNKK